MPRKNVGKQKKAKIKAKRSKSTKEKVELSFQKLNFPSYEDVIKIIEKKIGKRPPLPVNLTKGAWTKQALKVLEERYLYRDAEGKITEDPDQMCWRVAWEIASAEGFWGANRLEVKKIAKDFYNLLTTRQFLPNSPTLMNAGTKNMLQYSACFVLPVADSLEGIFNALKHQALIHQTGGGTGFSFSRLRPNGSIVRSSGGVASGPVSFMRIFDAATNEIKQGGKRRGANMGILRVDHPDVLEFIRCKEDGGITNFNISVAITNKFMQALEKGEDYELILTKHNGENIHNEVVGKLSAKDVWDKISENAWNSGDPGLVFIDRMNQGTSNPVSSLGPIEATNPCGEQMLYPYDACNLGSLFLNRFVKVLNGKKEIDWDKLKNTTRLATRFLDNVVQVNPFPLSEIRRTVLAIRRIGLGVGGWADLLIDLEIPYDSEEALKLAERVMKTIQSEAVKASQDLAKMRGPFPLWPKSIYKRQKPRRNSTVTTIAPTGTISIIAGASSGIEPLFALAYRHIVKDKHLDRKLTFVNPKFKEVAHGRGFWNEDIEKKLAEHGTIRHIKEIPEDVRSIFGTAHEIHHDWHIKMQAIFQKYTENAVSKTINLHNLAAVSEIKDAYLLAWKTNCKGITVFRDGCKETQVLNLGTKDGEKDSETIASKAVWRRPMKVSGSTYKIKTPVGTAFITVNHDASNNPIEVFINVGRAGSDVQAMAEALGRIISKSLKFGSNLTAKDRVVVIIDQLKGIGGRRSVGFGANKIRSLPDAIAVALATDLGVKINGNGKSYETKEDQSINGELEIVEDSMQVEGQESLPFSSKQQKDLKLNTQELFTAEVDLIGDICPSCGAGALVYEEGCVKCHACAYSEC